MKKIIIFLLIATLGLVGCKGLFTGHNYTTKEIAQVAIFLNVSEERLAKYANGDITLEDLNISKDRLEKAVDYVRHFRDKNSTAR